MAEFTQANRPFRIETGLGEDVLLLRRFTGEESISGLFHFSVDLLSADPAIDPGAVLRKPVTLVVRVRDQKQKESERKIHGIVSRFVQRGRGPTGLAAYRAEIVPWFWFLSLSSECRVHQNLTVPEIVEETLKRLGYNDFDFKLLQDHPKRGYCVQYRETHLNFVSRLLEEEGIFYFFDHDDSKHIMRMWDDPTNVQPCPIQPEVRMAASGVRFAEENVVRSVQREHSPFIGTVCLRDYDYLQPSLTLEASVSGKGVEEVYDYPGGFLAVEEGERLARIQLEEREGRQEVLRGYGTCRNFLVGYSFSLTDHFRRDINADYQLLSVRHSADAGDFQAGATAGFDYSCEFAAIPKGVPFRPPRRARKPVIQGSQTAVVVGKSGEDFTTEKHGRVKVQFHWDREGKKDDASSCWVRVATPWAGKGWGFQQTPRIGQEVIVDFLEGDPDQPIITGRVYNADQTIPYSDPTYSGVKSRSSKKGSPENFNEIRLEDKKGSELFYVHAEKDKQVTVENNRTESVGNDESISIGNNRSESVEKNESVSIGKNRDHSVGENATLSVGKNLTEDVGENRSESVGKDMSVQVGGKSDLSIDKDFTVTVTGDQAVAVDKNYGLVVTKKIQIEGKDSIELKSGDASITLKKNGDIQIKGGKINIKGSGDVIIKGTNVTQN